MADYFYITRFFWGVERGHDMVIVHNDRGYIVGYCGHCCRSGLGVPDLGEFCMDEPQGRAHMWFGDRKVCFKWDRSEVDRGDLGSSWRSDFYEETACTWN